MNLFTWLKRRMSPQYKTVWLYRRGVLRAKLHQNEAAIADYTAVINMADVPADIRAMALYNRALAYHATGSESDAINDLNEVLEVANVAGHVKTEARRKLVRMERTSNRTDAREADAESRSQAGTHAHTVPTTAGKPSHKR